MRSDVFTVIVGLFALCLAPARSLAQTTVIHDPNAVLRTVEEFHAIDVSDAIDCYLSQGDKQVVAISAAEIKWRDRIHTEIRNGRLRIWLEGAHGVKGRNKKARVYISFTTLDKLIASDESDIYVDGVISGKNLHIGLNGSSVFRGAVHLDELTVEQTEASNATITGSVTGMTHVDASGASNLKAYALETGTCDARATGASEIQMTVNKELTAHASGASRIYYHGDPAIRESNTSGASTISRTVIPDKRPAPAR